MITNFKRSTRGEIITAAVLLAVLSIAFLTEPRSLPAQSGEHGVENQYKDLSVFLPADQKPVGAPADEQTTDEQITYSPMSEQMKLAFENSNARGHLEIGDFYRERGNFVGAIQRYMSIVENFKNFEDMDEVIHRIAELYYDRTHSSDPDIAGSAGEHAAFWYSRIAEDYPFSRHHEEAERRLTSLGQGTTIGSFQPPELLERSFPLYTEEARKARIEGIVILNGTVRRNGTVDNIEVLRGLGYGLDEAAIRAFADSRFRPATRDGVPVDYSFTIEISFALYRP